MRSNIIYGLGMIACFLLVMSACSKDEDKLTPEEVYYFHYDLPQGSNDYDQVIKNVFDSTGVYILYKFDNEKDFRWMPPGGATTLKLNIYALNPDPNPPAPGFDTIRPAVNTLYENLKLYGSFSNNFIRNTAPPKFIVAGGFCGLTTNVNKPTGYDTAAVTNLNVTAGTVNGMIQTGSNHISVATARGGPGTAAITKFYPNYMTGGANQNNFRTPFHNAYWTWIYDYHYNELPTQFFSVVDYAQVKLWYDSGANAKNLVYYYGLTNPTANPKTDFQKFFEKVITTTQAAFNTTYSGTNDPRGLVKQRRDILVNYYKNKYGFDLQNLVNQ